MTAERPFRLDLAGLDARPAQVWGGIRLVPLVRAEPIAGLRLRAELYAEGYGVVNVAPRTTYTSYIPHGFIADWGADGGAAGGGTGAAYGTQLSGGGRPVTHMPLRVHRRMARRDGKQRLRFLPLHLALDGYLALHFGGPVIAWQEWSQRAVRSGLSPRSEEAYAGTAVRGLADALRVFEIHPGQCGVLVYAADGLAAAFAVPHPDDYRALHATLLLDLYGELIYQYALLSAAVPDFTSRLGDGVRTLPGLRAAVAEQQREWAAFHDDTMAAGLLAADYTARTAHRAGDFTLSRFLPAFLPREENHIGEAITAADGRLAYLKTFRLSQAQIRRGHLLTRLAAHDWHLPDTAAELGLTEAQLGLRIASAGFAHLLRQDILDSYRAQSRRAARS